MDKQIVFEVPAAVAEQDLPQYFRNRVEVFQDALDLTGDYYDRKSQVDGFEITRIDVDASGVVIHYRVEYSGFRPCQEIRYSETAHRRVLGVRSGQTFYFTAYQELERRSSCDEL